MRAIIWTSKLFAEVIRDRMRGDVVITTSERDFLAAERTADTISFVDDSTIGALGTFAPPRVVAITNEPLPTSVGYLNAHPWLAHVISVPLLQSAMATEHLKNVTRTLRAESEPRLLDWLARDIEGRRVRLAHASKRADRLDKMADYFASHEVGSRTIEQLRDAAEELLTNAFYDAPVAAGARSQPISRTQDVVASEEAACELVYGCRDDLAIVRVRDPFGSLTRQRLVEVLLRCSREKDVQVDESMGGAGLGLWRIFTTASFLAISVLPGEATEFLVGIGKRAPGPKPFAFHLFFEPTPLTFEDSSSNSITIVAD